MKRPAAAEEPPAKRAAGDGPGTSGVYLIHDNGGRPFKVSVQTGPKAQVQVFKSIQDKDDDDDEDDDDEEEGGSGATCKVMTVAELQKQLGKGGQQLLLQMAPEMAEGGESEEEDADEAEEDMPNYEEEACTSFDAERVFVGQCPKHGARFDGNSILLLKEGLEYVFVGESVFSFTAKSPITKYLSPVGNNDVPYPWAMDEQGFRYLMTFSVILGGKLFENSDTDPYDLFHDRALITADIGTVPPTQPFHKEFQGITEFWIGEGQFTLRYEPHPEEDFDRLAEMGELSVVKGGAKIKVSKADYLKLMQDYAEFAGVEPLHSETLIKRAI